MPDWWNALLWKKTMGEEVLNATVVHEQHEQQNNTSGGAAATTAHLGAQTTPPAVNAPFVRAYAHCMAGGAGGGVSLVLINTHNASTASVKVGFAGANTAEHAGGTRLQWRMTSKGGDSWGNATLLNGVELRITDASDGTWQLPSLEGQSAGAADPIAIPPGSYTFVAYPEAKAAACMQ
jgi:hypothetical protein